MVLASLGPVDEAIDAARAKAGEGDMAGAVEIIRAARSKQDDPDLIFVEAQLLRISGDCVGALPLYEEFLATTPPDEDRAEVEGYVETCRAEVPEPEPIPEPPPPEATPEPDPDPQPEPVEPPPPTETRPDRIGLALWITGGVLAVGGGATYGAAWGLRGQADAGNPTLDEYLDREQRARTLGGVGLATLGVGVGVLVAATVRHVLRNR